MALRSCLLFGLVAALALTVDCNRPTDPEAAYRSLASRIAGSWRLLREDHSPFLAHPPCLETLRIDMDAPTTSTAAVTYCAGGPSELSQRVALEIVAHPDPSRRECRINWDPGSTGAPREMRMLWSDAVYSVGGDGPVFYAEDVLTVEFSGPWLAEQPNAWGAIVDYARDTSAAAANYNPK